jgi:hypothetical protein
MTAPDAPGPDRPAPGEVAAYISKYSSKSRRYSTTLGALRRARSEYLARNTSRDLDGDQGDQLDGERGTQ